jgi:hypothetical protein
MVPKRTENWDTGDFYREFRKLASEAKEGVFSDKFNALAKELEPLGREFIIEKVGCGRKLDSVMEQIQLIRARSGYCRKPRGFEAECGSLYSDVDKAIMDLRALREVCFV